MLCFATFYVFFLEVIGFCCGWFLARFFFCVFLLGSLYVCDGGALFLCVGGRIGCMGERVFVVSSFCLVAWRYEVLMISYCLRVFFFGVCLLFLLFFEWLCVVF